MQHPVVFAGHPEEFHVIVDAVVLARFQGVALFGKKLGGTAAHFDADGSVVVVEPLRQEVAVAVCVPDHAEVSGNFGFVGNFFVGADHQNGQVGIGQRHLGTDRLRHQQKKEQLLHSTKIPESGGRTDNHAVFVHFC